MVLGTKQKLISMSNTVVNKAADNIRILSAAMVEKANSGHPGGAMGGADFVNILYTEFLQYDPMDMEWPFRDRFFLDPGHMSPMLYSVLALAGNYSIDDLNTRDSLLDLLESSVFSMNQDLRVLLDELMSRTARW